MSTITRRSGLRASNVHKHPGQIILENTQKRRPSEEVNAEKAAAIAKQQAAQASSRDKLKRLAQICQEQRQADEHATQSAATTAKAPQRGSPGNETKGKIYTLHLRQSLLMKCLLVSTNVPGKTAVEMDIDTNEPQAVRQTSRPKVSTSIKKSISYIPLKRNRKSDVPILKLKLPWLATHRLTNRLPVFLVKIQSARRPMLTLDP